MKEYLIKWKFNRWFQPIRTDIHQGEDAQSTWQEFKRNIEQNVVDGNDNPVSPIIISIEQI